MFTLFSRFTVDPSADGLCGQHVALWLRCRWVVRSYCQDGYWNVQAGTVCTVVPKGYLDRRITRSTVSDGGSTEDSAAEESCRGVLIFSEFSGMDVIKF